LASQKTDREIGIEYTKNRRKTKEEMIENTHEIPNIDMQPSENDASVKTKAKCFVLRIVVGLCLI
jgi:hypothetical protein